MPEWRRSDIVKLGAEELTPVETLLRNNGLPYKDCCHHIGNFVGVFCSEELIAIGGLELLGKTALLRSLAVRADYQKQGLAGLIVERLHCNTMELGIEALYLLTETAESFFHKLGYLDIDRDKLPVEVRQTEQCQSLCPASAHALVFHLPVDNF